MALPILGEDNSSLSQFTLMQAELNHLRQQNVNFTALLALLVPGKEQLIEIPEEELIHIDPRKVLNMDRVEGESGSIIRLWTSLREEDELTD